MIAQALSSRIAFFLSGILITSALLYGHRSYATYDAATRSPKLEKVLASSTATSPTKRDHFPAKIWQSWKDDSENPTERTVGFPHKWREVNPRHRYERLTDANIQTFVDDSRFAANVIDLFANVTDHILRADLLRYLVMLKEGGVWADIDVRPLQPVDRWIPEVYRGEEDSSEEVVVDVNMVVGIENDHDKNPIWPDVPYSVQLSQFTMLAKPNHPVFATLVDEVVQKLGALLESA